MTEEERIIKKIRKTPLRWYPSGKKVFTIGFRLEVFMKMTKCRIEHLIWRIKNGYL